MNSDGSLIIQIGLLGCFKRPIRAGQICRVGDDDDIIADVTECPTCLTITEHEILKRVSRGQGEDLLVRCVECSEVHLLKLRPSSSISIKTTLSEGPESSQYLLSRILMSLFLLEIYSKVFLV